MKVGRQYQFKATHSLPGVEGYDQPHGHLYTVEAVVEGDKNEDGMIVDTADLDFVGKHLITKHEGQNLNDQFDCPTTVENLAERWRELFTRVANPVTVRVWEDDERWGEAP